MTDRITTPEARHALIGRILSEHGRLDVADVADQLGVAQETVRRDLRSLESAGVLRRVHGGAIPAESDVRVPIPVLADPPAADAALAAHVWALLPRCGTVLVGNGPLGLALTGAVLADPPEVAGLTVVTNSLDAAVHLARVPRLSVYNIGGTVSHQTRAQEGDWAIEELGRLRVDVALLCPAGLSVQHGLSESTPAAAAVAQAQLNCAERRLVLCPAEVLGRSAFVRYASVAEVDEIMVAGEPDRAMLQSFHHAGARVDVVTAGRAAPEEDRVVTA